MTMPEFQPTDEERNQVSHLSGLGLNQGHIAALIRGGIDEKTLRKYFRHELDSGKAGRIQQVSSKLMEKIDMGDTASIMFYLKTQARWTENHKIDHSSTDGTMSPSIDPSKLSDSAIEEILKARKNDDQTDGHEGGSDARV